MHDLRKVESEFTFNVDGVDALVKARICKSLEKGDYSIQFSHNITSYTPLTSYATASEAEEALRITIEDLEKTNISGPNKFY